MARPKSKVPSTESSSGQTQRKKSLPRLLISLATQDPAGEIHVPLEAYLHFANEIAFDLEVLEEDLMAKRRALTRAEFGAATLKLLF
jgi:hypothetical protein